MKHWDEIVDDPVSDELRQETLRKAEVYSELNTNRDRRRRWFFFQLPAVGIAAGLAAFFGYRWSRTTLDSPPELNLADLDLEDLDLAEMELADLNIETPEDLDVLENLDILEELDWLENWDSWEDS